jgi:hypothetical protein
MSPGEGKLAISPSIHFLDKKFCIQYTLKKDSLKGLELTAKWPVPLWPNRRGPCWQALNRAGTGQERAQ